MPKLVERILTVQYSSPKCMRTKNGARGKNVISEVVIFQDIILCLCKMCCTKNDREVHVFDLFTQSWWDNCLQRPSLLKGVFGQGRKLFATDVKKRLHVVGNDQAVAIFYRTVLAIQMLTANRFFELTHVINLTYDPSSSFAFIDSYAIFFPSSGASMLVVGQDMGAEGDDDEQAFYEIAFKDVKEAPAANSEAKSSVQKPKQFSSVINRSGLPDTCRVMEVDTVRKKAASEREGEWYQNADIFRIGNVIYVVALEKDCYKQATYDISTGEVDELLGACDANVNSERPLRAWLNAQKNVRVVVDLGVDDRWPERFEGPFPAWWAVHVNAKTKHLYWESIENPLVKAGIPMTCNDRMLVTEQGDLMVLHCYTGDWYRIPWNRNVLAGTPIAVPPLEYLARQAVLNRLYVKAKVAIATHAMDTKTLFEAVLRARKVKDAKPLKRKRRGCGHMPAFELVWDEDRELL